ncbi:MAG TPA: ATPase, T2SS/T4P/T4SS family [Planctomycetota bacterium]|nr:ATPase, T2SS/T4P/T4SS family [Planctomycetota bacterium]
MAASTKKVEGDLRSFTIFDITQTLLAGRKTASVTIQSGARRASLFFDAGQIVHAVDDAMNTGETAAFAVFTWRQGSFVIDFEAKVADRNVDRPTDWLLLEVARNLDEAHAEGEAAGAPPPDAAIEKTVGDKLEHRLKHELNQAFRKVAERAEPARARYVRNAFDGLLRALHEGRGSALFLQPRTTPRVKSPQGFVSVDEAPLTDDELRGFLQSALNDVERKALRERREVVTYYDAGELGVYRMTAVEDDGSPFVTFAPSRRDVPEFESYRLGLPGDALAAAAEGLVAIAGPLGAGKSTLMAALVRHHLVRHDRFVSIFAAGVPFEHPADRGVVVHRRLPDPGKPFVDAVRSALEQRAEVIAVDGVPDREALHVCMSVARTGRLVLASFDSLSPAETVGRLQSLTQEPSGERLGAILAETLRAVVDLGARRTHEPPKADVWIVGRDEQSALATNDFTALRRLRATVRVGV